MHKLKSNRMRHRTLFVILMAALLVEIASCGSSAPPITVTVSSSVASIPVNGAVFFFATVVNSKNQNVTWAVKGGAANGAISSSGLYTAPAQVPAPAQVTITATPQADSAVSGQASITVTVGVSISPSVASVGVLNPEIFSATAQGTSNQNFTWQVNGIVGGNPSIGTITGNGAVEVYQAPESVPVNASTGQTTTVTVTAVSQADPAVSASAIVTITSRNDFNRGLPTPLGISGGNANNVNTTECASGTLGSLVVRNGTQFVLSNNHVLADSDAGSIGDPIIAPGLIDASPPCTQGNTNTVAHLSQFINLEQPNPPADAAIAQVVASPVSVDPAGTIIELGDSTPGGTPSDEPPASTILPVASLVPNSTAVAKSGRSTGLTCSTVEATSVTVSVQYNHGLSGPAFTARYTNQITINGGTFSAAGDSGSLIVSQAGAQPVALLYAGSSASTIGAPVATVLANLGDNSNPQNFPTFVGPATRNPVVGCTSSGADAFNATAPAQSATAAPSAAEFSKAAAAANENAGQLLSVHPAMLAVGVARSLDRPARAAVVFFVRKGQPLVRPMPESVAGVPTRVIAVDSVAKSGLLDRQTTETFAKSAPPSPALHPTQQQLATAKAVKEKYADSFMKQPGILGVGVTSSLDNPSDAAVIVYVEEGKPHNPIPLELDGLRVRVKATSPFRAFGWGHPKPH